jgi:hypothetical protein
MLDMSLHSHSLLHGVFLIIFFFHQNLHKVVQRAHPSYNPRGTCPRSADLPAAPFQALIEAMFLLSPLIVTRRRPFKTTKSAIDVNTFPSIEYLLAI